MSGSWYILARKYSNNRLTSNAIKEKCFELNNTVTPIIYIQSFLENWISVIFQCISRWNESMHINIRPLEWIRHIIEPYIIDHPKLIWKLLTKWKKDYVGNVSSENCRKTNVVSPDSVLADCRWNFCCEILKHAPIPPLTLPPRPHAAAAAAAGLFQSPSDIRSVLYLFCLICFLM